MMELIMKNYKYALAAAMAATMITLVGCVVPGPPGYPATSVDDANVSAQIRTALMNEAVFKVNQIRIETTNGVVTLTGTVQSRPEADRVVEMTKTIQGVREIRNSLDIRP
jgi:hyperosmotically inducible protein